MSTELSLLTVLMDRKRHSREELIDILYKSVRGTKIGRLAARVNDLRNKGYAIDSPLIRYVNGKRVAFKVIGRARAEKEFWYMLKGSRSVWKTIEKEWSERVAAKRSIASKKAAKTMKKRRLIDA